MNLPARSPRLRAWLVAGLLLLHAWLGWLVRPPGIMTGQDDATYVLLGRELRHASYRATWEVGSPVHRLYPPGYPVLLGLAGAVSGDRIDALMAVGILASTGALLLVFLTAERLHSTGFALLCLAALAVNPSLVSTAGGIASEAPYTFFSVLALALLARPEPPRGILVAAGGAAIAAGLTRNAGVTLLAAIGIHWLIQRRFRALSLLTLAGVMTAGAWIAWSLSAPGPDIAGLSYRSDLTFVPAAVRASSGGSGLLVSTLVHRVADNVPNYLGRMLPGLLPLPTIPGTTIDNLVDAAIACGALLMGFIPLLRRWRPAALYLLAYGALLALWPWSLPRFLVVLLPILVPVALAGAGSLAGRFSARPALVVTILAAVLALTGAIRTLDRIRATAGCRREWTPPDATCSSPDQASFFTATKFIRKRTPAEAVFVTAKRATLYYYATRRSMPLAAALAAGQDRLDSAMRAYGARYILLGSLYVAEPNQLQRILTARCAGLRVVAAFPPRTFLFAVADSGDAGAPDACGALADYRRANQGRNFDTDAILW